MEVFPQQPPEGITLTGVVHVFLFAERIQVALLLPRTGMERVIERLSPLHAQVLTVVLQAPPDALAP
jgi:hypothetical protein